jgi:Tripartite tricarboxylate transporter family receptor
MGAKPTLVPFNGGAPAMNALVSGQVDYMCADIVTGGTHLESGRIKVYAIASAERNPALASIPTTVEAGLPEFQASAWNGLFAPKATPKPIIDKLVDALDKALDDDVTRKRLLVLGCDIPDKPKRGPQKICSSKPMSPIDHGKANQALVRHRHSRSPNAVADRLRAFRQGQATKPSAIGIRFFRSSSVF